MSALVAVVLAVVLWTVNQALRQIPRRAGADRAQTAADQVASLMARNSARG